MTLIRWDPWQEIQELHAQTSRLIDSFLERLNAGGEVDESIDFLPEADFVETPDEYRVYLAVPGLIEDDLELEVDAESLTVRGEREPPYDPVFQPMFREWRYGFFERKITFPTPIRAEDVRAFCDNGLLSVFLPKDT